MHRNATSTQDRKSRSQNLTTVKFRRDLHRQHNHIPRQHGTAICQHLILSAPHSLLTNSVRVNRDRHAIVAGQQKLDGDVRVIDDGENAGVEAVVG